MPSFPRTKPRKLRYANIGLSIRSIILINAAQQYLQLLTFNIPLSYVQAIQAGQPLDPNNESHYITIKTTRILNLARTDDRIVMFRHLGALIQWLKSQ